MSEMQSRDSGTWNVPENTKKPADREQKQYLFQLVTMIACVITAAVVSVTAVILVPKTVVTMNQAQETMTQLNTMAGEAEGMLQDLNTISSSLSQFVNGGSEGGSSLKDLDISALNDSIQKLQSIAESLANLFRYEK